MKIFKDTISRDQLMLLPPCVDDFIDKDDSVRVFNDTIDSMTLDYLYDSYKGGGAPAFEPKLMMKIIIFGYSIGIRSSRKLETALRSDVRFMYLAQMSRPKFSKICTFRRSHLDEIKKVFEETVRICLDLDVALLQHVSLDGTKIEANVGGKNTFGKERVVKELSRIDETIKAILDEAEAEDLKEDGIYGDARGDELPKALTNAQDRKKLIEEAKKKIDESNLNNYCATDPESRVMKTRSGNRPAYNAQAVVDKENQVIVAARITQDESDNHQLSGMMDELTRVTGKKPDCVTVDGGYNSTDSLKYIEENALNAYMPMNNYGSKAVGFTYDESADLFTCPCGEQLEYSRTRICSKNTYRVYRHTCSSCPRRMECCGKKNKVKEIWKRLNTELQDKMVAKMQSIEARNIYRLRKQIVEPVHGNIKFNKGLWKFLLTGIEGAQIEYFLGCIAHNLGKITKSKQKRELVPA